MILKFKLKKLPNIFKIYFKMYIKEQRRERLTSYENMLLSLKNMILMVHPIH